MKNKKNIFIILLFTSVFTLIFYRWFLQSEIVGGDWPYLFKESLRNYSLLVPSWNAWQGNGLGGTSPIYFLQSFEYPTVFLANTLHIPWLVVYKISWFGFFIFLSVLTSTYLINTILGKLMLWQKLLGAIIFTTNTYILMLVGGGQMGIALSYAVAPIVLARFIKLVDHIASFNKNFQFSIFNFKLVLLAGLALSLQVLFDPRIAYITMIAVGIYMALNIKKNILNSFILILYTLIIPGLVTFLLHIFWILPLLTFSQDLYQRFGDSDTSIGIVKFLSFSSFSQSFSLLHPNWPENIFGKVGFMKPEFILLPIIVYSSLLFKLSRKTLFFALLGIVGVFLAKGANPPFGEFYLWSFKNIPGFEMFRDSTKFYLLVALSYSVLIPFSLWKLVKIASSIKYKVLSIHNAYYIIPATFLVVWVILIHPAILGQLRGTFKSHEVPKEYINLKDFLYRQPEFFRTLWVPRQHRFTFFSNIHPSIEAGSLFNATSSAEVLRELGKTGTKEYLSELSVKYVIVPYDSLGEFFLTDRKYDSKIPGKISKSLENISWLKKIDGFGNIAIFEAPFPKDHFWLEKSGKISYKMISPTSYSVNVSLTYSQKLIFSEKYNSSWAIKIGNKIIKSEKTPSNINSFVLEKGDYDLEVFFLQDKTYNYGRAISLVAFFGVLFFIFKYRKHSSLSN